jgi:hypothetical protein
VAAGVELDPDVLRWKPGANIWIGSAAFYENDELPATVPASVCEAGDRAELHRILLLFSLKPAVTIASCHVALEALVRPSDRATELPLL